MDFATEEAIKVEMRNWSAHALEIPNEYYNNMPACPYAKKAWATDKVGFLSNMTKIGRPSIH